MTAADICRNTTRFGVTLSVVIVGTVACSSGKTVSTDSATSPPSRVLEQHRLDIDGDSVLDSIVVLRADSSAPGATSRIELQLSHAGARVLEDSNRWDPAPEEFNGYGSLLKSRLLYVADFYRAGRLLFLFGGKVGCCQQSLTIYRLGANGPEKYFYDPELFIDRSPVPQANKVAVIAGRRLSQAAAPPSSEFVSAVTYAPVIVYRLEEKPRIDSAATKALTREELGGFAGFEYRTDVAALRRSNGAKVLWNLRERRAIPYSR
jgi:hypothetical protein